MNQASILLNLAGILGVAALISYILQYLQPATFSLATTAILTLAAAFATVGVLVSQDND